jgi:hypothetical protein
LQGSEITLQEGVEIKQGRGPKELMEFEIERSTYALAQSSVFTKNGPMIRVRADVPCIFPALPCKKVEWKRTVAHPAKNIGTSAWQRMYDVSRV